MAIEIRRKQIAVRKAIGNNHENLKNSLPGKYNQAQKTTLQTLLLSQQNE